MASRCTWDTEKQSFRGKEQEKNVRGVNTKPKTRIDYIT